MREQEFKQWLESEGKINFYLSGNRRIENDEDIDLDKEFQENNLERLLQLYAYSKADEKANRRNPTRLGIEDGASIYNVLTIHRSALRQYRRFCLSEGDAPIQEIPDSSSDTDIEPTETGATFGLEADLQDAIRENITQLESGLEIIDNGVERKVTSGFIDILAKDSNGTFVVIELKAGKARDAVIAQTLGYMGDIAQAENQPVRGIIVAGDFNQRVRSASKAIPNLDLNSYSYTFDFKKET